MIIALPISRDRLASHFTKAQQIHFYDAQQQLLLAIPNPALGGSCQDKKAMLDAIRAQKTSIVVVQNIGERMLGKLLEAGISVSRGDSLLSIAALLEQSQALNLRLTDASEGRVSLKHAAKGGCCSGKDSHDGHSGCCGSKDSHDSHKEGCGCSKGGCGSKTGAAESKTAMIQRAQEAPAFSSARPITYAGFRAAQK